MMPYGEYQDDYQDYQDGSFASFTFVTSEQEQVRIRELSGNCCLVNFQVRNRRQLILQFITANKGRLSDTYVCLICNKQVTDNSNMNKHLEFKHGSELKLFLQSLAL